MITISRADDISILHLFGEISLLEMEMIEKLIQSLKKHNHTKILIDLANVDHVHFQAVHRWAGEAIDLRKEEGDLKLVGANRETQQVLKFVGADQHLKDYASVSEAILSFLRAPGSLMGYSYDGFGAEIQEPQNSQSRWRPVRSRNPEELLH